MTLIDDNAPMRKILGDIWPFSWGPQGGGLFLTAERHDPVHIHVADSTSVLREAILQSDIPGVERVHILGSLQRCFPRPNRPDG